MQKNSQNPKKIPPKKVQKIHKKPKNSQKFQNWSKNQKKKKKEIPVSNFGWLAFALVLLCLAWS